MKDQLNLEIEINNQSGLYIRDIENLFNKRLLETNGNYLKSHIARRAFKKAIETLYKLNSKDRT